MGKPVRAVLFDLGNTLVAYYHKSEFAPVLRESIEGVSDFLADRRSVFAGLILLASAAAMALFFP